MKVSISGEMEGRYQSWKKRNHQNLCFFHPYIHPLNLGKITLKEGEVSKKVGSAIETQKFRYCPKCLLIKQEIKIDEKR